MHKRDRKISMQNISKEEAYFSLQHRFRIANIKFMGVFLFLLKFCTHITCASPLFRKPDVCLGKTNSINSGLTAKTAGFILVSIMTKALPSQDGTPAIGKLAE